MPIAVLHIDMPVLIAIMMQRNAIELLKRIRDFPARRIKPTVERYALHLTRGYAPPFILARDRRAEIDGMRFLDVAEVDGVDAAALVGDDGRFLVTEESPGGGAEKGLGFDV